MNRHARTPGYADDASMQYIQLHLQPSTSPRVMPGGEAL